MTTSLKDRIRSTMKDKSTEELLGIWRANDRSTYSAGAFDAIADELRERGVEVPLQPQTGRHPDHGATAIDVVVTDIRMPFTSMVAFMVKWAIASIPAAIVLIVAAMTIVALLGGVLGGLFSALRR